MNDDGATGQRWRLVVEYHGSAFVGWQIQPAGRSVQGVLEAAAEALFGHPCAMRASGRTDAGVHALGQVVAFDAHAPRSPRAVRDGLNANLPSDVAVVGARPVVSSFDPRRDQVRKTYRYAWLDRRARSPLVADRAWHVHAGHLDDRRMHDAVQALVGTHDMASFRAVGCAARHTVRTLEAARVGRDGDLVWMELVGTGFLRHMVRIVAGTVTEVGLGRAPITRVEEARVAQRRDAAGRTAPAHGLTLIEVCYADGPGLGAPPG